MSLASWPESAASPLVDTLHFTYFQIYTWGQAGFFSPWMLRQATDEFQRLAFLHSQIPIDQAGTLHPQVAKGAETTKA